MKVGHRSVIRFLKCYQGRQSLENAPRSGRPTGEVTLEMMNFLDTEMERNDEVTAPELTGGINNRFETRFSQPKIKRLRQKLGWVGTKTKYCQLIRESNCIKRLQFSQKYWQDDEQFEDVIFTDECSVMLENHTKILFHREGEQGIPLKCMFGEAFQNRGQPNSLFSMVKWMPDFMSRKFYPTGCSLSLGKPAGGHRFQQDNDPKHTSRRATTFMEENDINWWKTPPELPD